MNNPGPAAASVPAKDAIAQGWRWLNCGWQRLSEQRLLWLGMSELYLIGAVLLEAIPFVGHLVLVLVSPMLLAGALLALKEPSSISTDPASARTNAFAHPLDYVRVPACQLLGAFNTESRIYAAVLMGIVVLGMVVVVAICQYFIGAGTLGSGWSAARHGTAPPALLFVRLLAAGILDVLLFMGLLYAVHRAVFAWREPMTAIAESFRACARYPLPLSVFAGAFVLPYIAIAGAFRLTSWFGYALLFTLGAVLLPLFVLTSYCSYRDIFPSSARD